MPAILRGLQGKNVLITGAAKGIGFAIAKQFADAGSDIAIFDIAAPIKDAYALASREHLDAAAKAIKDYGRNCLPVICDVRDEEQVKAGVAETLDFFHGRIDVLVNVAGVAAIDSITAMRGPMVDAVIDTSVKGAIYLAKYVVPQMIERRSGKIVNMSSGTTGAGMANVSHYVAAKHAVNGLTVSWAFELAEYGINVNAVGPAAIKPDAGQGSGMVLGLANNLGLEPAAAFEAFAVNGAMPGEKWKTTVDDVADSVLFLASDNADQITGHVLFVDGGQAAK